MLNFPIKKLRIILWSLLGLVVLFLLWRGVIPSGEITYSTNLEKRNDFIGRISPETRVKEKGKRIIGNPVYFSLRTPRNFQTAEIILFYKNRDFPIIEAGLLVDGQLWRYKTKPLQNKILDDLSQAWSTLVRDDLMLLQKKKEFSSIDEFLSDPPSVQEIAVYNYDLDNKFVLPNYSATSSEQVWDTDLRGDYQFYTYIKQEKLDFDFSFRDINQEQGEDPVDISLYFRDKIIDSRHLSDDGLSKGVAGSRPSRSVNLQASGLPEGVYKIEVRAGNDIITEKIKTGQKKLAFINQLSLASTTGKFEQKIYTTGDELSAKVLDPLYLQTLEVKNKDQEKKLDIDQTYKRFALSLVDCSPCRLNLEKGGIDLFSNGVFSFSRDSLLDPSIPRVDTGFDPDKQDIKYVLARYTSPQKDKGRYKATAGFDLSAGYKEDNKYNFMISVPGLKAEDGTEDSVAIERIEIKLKGKTLWEKFIN